MQKLLSDDPLLEAPTWRRVGEGDTLTSKSGREFTLDMRGVPPENAPTDDLVAFEGTKEMWRAKGFSVAGGGFSLSLSPRETIVARSYSRGTTELFDAASGRPIANVGNGVLVSPDDAYWIDPPTMVFGLEKRTHPEVFLTRSTDEKSIILGTLPPGRDEGFEVGICATGATFALARDTGELAVFGGPALARVAALDHPGPGQPRFSRTGRLLAMISLYDGKPSRLFALH